MRDGLVRRPAAGLRASSLPPPAQSGGRLGPLCAEAPLAAWAGCCVPAADSEAPGDEPESHTPPVSQWRWSRGPGETDLLPGASESAGSHEPAGGDVRRRSESLNLPSPTVTAISDMLALRPLMIRIWRKHASRSLGQESYAREHVSMRRRQMGIVLDGFITRPTIIHRFAGRPPLRHEKGRREH